MATDRERGRGEGRKEERESGGRKKEDKTRKDDGVNSNTVIRPQSDHFFMKLI